jgi:hypothetical protein
VLVAGKAADIIADAAGGSSAATEKTDRYEWQAFHCAKVEKIFSKIRVIIISYPFRMSHLLFQLEFKLVT